MTALRAPRRRRFGVMVTEALAFGAAVFVIGFWLFIVG